MEKKVKATKRESKRKLKMKVSGKSVFGLASIITKKSEASSGSARLTKRT